MFCPEYQRLKKEEINAWTAYNYLKHSNRLDQEQLKKRLDRASAATARVDQHIAICPQCKTLQSA
jgi:hypothetical protein